MAALAPIALESPQKAARTGGIWGLGHGVGVLVVGGVGLALRGLVDIEAWSHWAEFTVGLLLVAIGIWAIVRAGNVEVHVHAHEHGNGEHEHVHAHPPKGPRHDHAAFGVGVFHGMAGSGHLFGVIPALALPTGQAVIYLVAYLVAAVASMSLFASGLGVLAKRGGTLWIRRLMYVSGALALVVGLFWSYNAWPF